MPDVADGGDIASVLRVYYEQAYDFVLDLTFDLAHDYLFLTLHFPIFFLIQSVWICTVVRRCSSNFPWWKSFVISSFMTFLGRVVVAFVTLRRPPLFENPLYIPLFIAIWVLVNCSPFDIVYSLLNFAPVSFVFQYAFALVQVREVSHGVDLGLRAFPAGTGALLISLVLTSTESFVWLLFSPETREFSNRVVLRNFAAAVAYLVLTEYPELFPEWVDKTKEGVKIWTLGVYALIVFVDLIVFRLRGRNGFDVTFLSYIGLLCRYCGDKE
jgi:hypothetical protein